MTARWTVWGVFARRRRVLAAAAALALLALALMALPASTPLSPCALDAQSCAVPKTCPHQIDDFIQCAGQNTYYYRQFVTADDDGGLGGGNCDGPPCSNHIVFDNPSPAMFPTGLWWRMHDHEEGVVYRLYVDTGGGWQEVDAGGVHTSGEGCQESCSKNTARYHPPGDQGCPDAPLSPFGAGWHTNADIDPGWPLRELSRQAPSLEDLFVNLTHGKGGGK